MTCVRSIRVDTRDLPQVFTNANFVLANFTKKLGLGQTPLPPSLGQNPKIGRKKLMARGGLSYSNYHFS